MVLCKWRRHERTSKRALLIGIEYNGGDKLKGTIRDIKRFSWVLRTYYSFENEELLVLTDSDNTGINHVEHNLATKKSILESLKHFTWNLEEGDQLILFFAGHGGQKIQIPGIGAARTEGDGLDEFIYPSNFKTAGYIDDDALYDHVVEGIPDGVLLTAIMDCCHSGTLLDLPYIYDPDNEGIGIINEENSTKNLAKDLTKSFKTMKTRFGKGDLQGAAHALGGAGSRFVQGFKKSGKEQNDKIDGLVFLLSAGKDDERALAKTEDGYFCGALTDALIKMIFASEDKTVTIEDVITKLRTDLASRNQTPQISCSKIFKMTDIFLNA